MEVVSDPILRLERSKEYADAKAILQDKWRPVIYERDKKCRVCGDADRENLHLAHITTVRAFVTKLGLEGMELAYSDDNLLMLCSACHKSQHKKLVFVTTDELEALRRKQGEMRSQPQIKEWLALNERIGQLIDAGKIDARRRANEVSSLFDEAKEQRGWSSAAQKIARSLPAEALPIVDRFFAKTGLIRDRCSLCGYEPTSGYLVDRRTGKQFSRKGLEELPEAEWGNVANACNRCKKALYFKFQGRST
jgi:5-methylcytosine-specific restriction endonuclease McrA